jgi:hypothetical protein
MSAAGDVILALAQLRAALDSIVVLDTRELGALPRRLEPVRSAVAAASAPGPPRIEVCVLSGRVLQGQEFYWRGGRLPPAVAMRHGAELTFILSAAGLIAFVNERASITSWKVTVEGALDAWAIDRRDTARSELTTAQLCAEWGAGLDSLLDHRQALKPVILYSMRRAAAALEDALRE